MVPRQPSASSSAKLLTELPTLLNRPEARVRRATSLTIPAKKFGLEAMRRDRNNDEQEGLAESLRTLLQNIESNQAALKARGQPDTENQQLHQLYADLVQEGTGFGSSVSDQRLLTADNVKRYKTLYDLIVDVLKDGKSLYKSTDPARVKDYTLSQVLKRVRRVQGEVDGPVDEKEA